MIIDHCQYRNINWRKFPIFLMPWYLDVVYGENCWNAIIEMKDEQIFAVHPYYKNLENCLIMPTLTQYAGPYLMLPTNLSSSKKYSLQEQLLMGLLKQIDDLKLSCYAQRWGPWIENWMPAFWMSFSHEPRLTYILDCRYPYEEVCQRYSSQVRNKLKNNSLRFMEGSSAKRLYELSSMSLEMHKKKPKFSLNSLEYLTESSVKNQCGKIVYAYLDDQCISGALILKDTKKMYFYIAGNDPKYSQYNASTLLIDYCIKLACQQGLLFDFTGSMLPSLSRFYRGFGATLINYPIITKIYTEVFDEKMYHEDHLREYIFKF